MPARARLSASAAGTMCRRIFVALDVYRKWNDRHSVAELRQMSSVAVTRTRAGRAAEASATEPRKSLIDYRFPNVRDDGTGKHRHLGPKQARSGFDPIRRRSAGLPLHPPRCRRTSSRRLGFPIMEARGQAYG